MMSSRLRISRVVCTVLLLLMSGCVVIPAQEMSDARQALQAAETAGAPDKAPGAYAAAVELLSLADQYLEKGEYDKARAYAEQAKQAALQARHRAMAAP